MISRPWSRPTACVLQTLAGTRTRCTVMTLASSASGSMSGEMYRSAAGTLNLTTMTCLMDVPTGCVVGAQIRTHLAVELGYMITTGYSHASWFRPAPKETMGGKGLSQGCPFLSLLLLYWNLMPLYYLWLRSPLLSYLVNVAIIVSISSYQCTILNYRSLH